MRTALFMGLVVFLTGCASFQPPENWTKADTRRQIAYSTALALDAVTTARIRRTPGLEEHWPIAREILGERPESTETYVAAALAGLAHYWIARRMKPTRRKVFQYVALGSHVGAVNQNCDNELC